MISTGVVLTGDIAARGFVHYILKPIEAMFSSVMSNEKEKYTKLCEKLDIKIPKDATDFQGKGMEIALESCLIVLCLILGCSIVVKFTCFIFLLIVLYCSSPQAHHADLVTRG